LSISRKTLLFLAYVSVIVAFAGLCGSMMSNIRERTYEIGVKKALGASRSQIFLQFLTEGIVIMTASVLLSAILCSGVILLLKNAGIINITIDYRDTSHIMARLYLLGTAFCIYPCRRGSKISIAEALRKSPD